MDRVPEEIFDGRNNAGSRQCGEAVAVAFDVAIAALLEAGSAWHIALDQANSSQGLAA
jgi:hypothetical protein